MIKRKNNNSPLKIAVLGHKTIPSRQGGIEIVVEELTVRMAKLGHKITVYNRSGHHVSGKEFDGKKLKEYKGIRMKYVPTIDKKGLVHYKSRLKRMIITSGYNVYPANVEEIIMQHESVLKCAVIGVKDDNKGEIVKAFIVLKEGKNAILSKVSIQKHLKKHLARYEQPREIEFLQDLPTTKLGKVAYKELEELDKKKS